VNKHYLFAANNGCDGGEDFRSYEYIIKNGGIATEEDYGIDLDMIVTIEVAKLDLFHKYRSLSRN